ncbi:13130_t:CDS:1 [Acaulospora morrowiae]|uniref:13130_t:CDS:1 n=1 Tax=Acaulospora morrowiae TaxID=94023 RepID=A0A9N9GLB3_9GLOM|nr:13130_t:CDS:1 [Acaulospora morrowiae]
MAESWNEMVELTIMNCWKKMDILPLVSNDEIEFNKNVHQESSGQEKCQIRELLSDFTSKKINPTIIQEIQYYVLITNANIPIKEFLNDAQIVEIVLAEQLEDEQGNLNDSNEELCNILSLNILLGLKNFIIFFKQQMSSDFNADDLKVFQKYLPLMEKKNAEAKKQKSIMDFFDSLKIQETTNNN